MACVNALLYSINWDPLAGAGGGGQQGSKGVTRSKNKCMHPYTGPNSKLL